MTLPAAGLSCTPAAVTTPLPAAGLSGPLLVVGATQFPQVVGERGHKQTVVPQDKQYAPPARPHPSNVMSGRLAAVNFLSSSIFFFVISRR